MGSALVSRAFPGFSHVYLWSTGSYTAFRGDIEVDDEFALTRAEKMPPGPVEVRWAMGRKKPSDVIRTTLAVPFVVSERVVNILKANQFSGWQTYPINLFGKDGARIAGYQGLAVHGRCGPIDDSKSEKFQAIYPGGVFPAWYGMFFDPSTWDGSDLFMPAGSDMGYVFVVGAVKRAFEKEKITNVVFTPLDELERPGLHIS